LLSSFKNYKMKKAIKKISILFVTISFTLIMFDFSIIGNIIVNIKLFNNIEINDNSADLEQPVQDCIEDDILNNVSISNLNMVFDNIEILPVIIFNLTKSFYSSIWQPPRFS
jgi:hypothetical protein